VAKSFTLALISAFAFFGCSSDEKGSHQHKPSSEITVGMTYNEVESILGKPLAISRGASQLVAAELLLEADTNYFDQPGPTTTAKKESLAQVGARMYRQQVETVGQLIYVTWQYPQTRRDTTYTLSCNPPKYLINGQVVSKSFFDGIGDLVYFDDQGRPITAAQRDARYTENSFAHLPRPIAAHKRVVGRDNIIRRNYYETLLQYCITFDASSGRVVTSGYQPMTIERLQ
jgi:hypothetical protein